VKLSAQAQRVIYIPNSSGKLEQQEISEIRERPTINNAIYSRSGSPAGEVMRTPISEDNPGSLGPQLTMERPTHQIAVSVDESQIIQNTDGIRFSTIPSSAFEEASFAGVDKVQELQHQEIIPQTPREYVRTEGNIQEIQPELVAEEKVDRTHQPLQQEITSQDVQGYGKHPQINDEVRSEMRYGAALLDAFEADSVAEKVQESQQQAIIPQTPREYVRIEDNIQEIQPDLSKEKETGRIHQPLRQEITSQNVQGYGKHPQINDEVRSEMRYGVAPLGALEGASVTGKVQESQQQAIIPQTPREYVRTQDNIQEVQPELVAEEKVDRIHMTQDAQEYGKHPQLNDEMRSGVRYGSAPLDAFAGASVPEKVQESQPHKIMPQTPREYVRIEGNIQEIQPELLAEEKADRIHQPLPQEIITQDVQGYGKHLELNDEAKIETRYGAVLSDAFEVGSVAGKVQKSQSQETILQAVQESVRAKDDVQEIQPELSRNKETGRIHQLIQQEVSSQNVQEYGKHLELRTESQTFGKEIQAAASMPELQDKIPFYVSRMVAGERSEAIWIQLEPEHLGKVKLRVLLRDSKISVNLSVDRPETKGIIELQVPDIRRSLAQHEIDVAEFRVSLENGFSNSNPRYSNLLHDNADTDSLPAYERGDWNRSKGEHNTRQRYYRSDSLVDLLA
jgi:flagellar hook-length control protein FliK